MSLQGLLDNVRRPQGNGTGSADASNGAYIPSALFESMIPGYGPIHKFLLANFGFDISIVVTLFATFWVIFKISSYTYGMVYSTIMENYTSSVLINSYDDIFQHLMKWLADQPKMKTSRSLMAETAHKSAWEADDEYVEDKSMDAHGNLALLNFSNQEAKAPPRFVPAFGSHYFRHNGTYFLLHRLQKQTLEQNSLTVVDKEDMTLTCFGRSPEPIKKLLQDAKNFFLQDNNAKTVIRRPAAKEMRRFGARHCWTQIAHRPCRPMDTVVLDAQRKAEVLSDINEYLHPSTPRWYANRGIPYRRGYLFHGPPGTGKTSLSFALAGVFGLDIYVISLLEPSITEEDLGHLFNSLPRRCVVLLEDIDTAGLLRTNDDAAKDGANDKEKSAAKSNKDENSGDWKVADLAKALKKANDATEEEKKKGISLSGLLNAIDGVASHEGRVLVMTTNKPEKLDDALIRPGRVDLQVAFCNATRIQIRELFQRMYTSDAAKSKLSSHAVVQATTASTKKDAISVLTPPATPTKPTGSISLTHPLSSGRALIPAGSGKPERMLEEIADAFAKKIPDGEFSPAEIQGFLLKRKKNPQKADADVERWVESMLEQRANKTKILGVQ